MRAVWLLLAPIALFAQTPATRPAFGAFEVATIKPAATDQAGRYIRMQSVNRFYAKGFTLNALVAAAYSLTPRAISGGPPWADSDRYDILASTPGDIQPKLDEQMAMLRRLLTDRFQLTFHRESKELPVFAITVAKGGPKLKPSTAPPGALPYLINTIYPEEKGGVHVLLPARNATMMQLAAMMQRAVVDRAVVDNTGLSGTYDFDLEWAPDESQFAGQLQRSVESTKPSLFTAMQEQLGLRLEATKGPVAALVIDRVERPSEN
ncbi:MAG: TIGR03435 family protein [Acidobacteriia bacterium]|nr:TIGR03435 family protein [Terriglobia bacterium]